MYLLSTFRAACGTSNFDETETDDGVVSDANLNLNSNANANANVNEVDFFDNNEIDNNVASVNSDLQPSISDDSRPDSRIGSRSSSRASSRPSSRVRRFN